MSILNLNVSAAVKFIRDSSADIISLQEVNNKVYTELLTFIQDNSLHFVECPEMIRKDDSTASRQLLISKLPLAGSGAFEYYIGHINSWYLTLARKIFSLKEQSKAVYIEVYIGDKKMRIYNLHLTWATGPRRRVAQFEEFCVHSDFHAPAIICGDLNVFGGLQYYNFMTSLFFGYKLDELLFDERRYFDTKFAQMDLQNPFAGTISWPLIPFNAQLDHILVPQNATIVSKQLFDKLYGSDHLPQYLSIDI